MGRPQTEFLSRLQTEVDAAFGCDLIWCGGQAAANCAKLAPVLATRRGGKLRPREEFELGDLRTDLCGRMVVIEHESDAISLHNLLKYWPFIRGELTVQPMLPIVICHFSNWGSYGSHRDLWEWLLGRMGEDPMRKVEITGRQFDHGGNDPALRSDGITSCVRWLNELLR